MASGSSSGRGTSVGLLELRLLPSLKCGLNMAAKTGGEAEDFRGDEEVSWIRRANNEEDIPSWIDRQDFSCWI